MFKCGRRTRAAARNLKSRRWQDAGEGVRAVEEIAGNQQGIDLLNDQCLEQPVKELVMLVGSFVAVEGLPQVPIGGVEDAHLVGSLQGKMVVCSTHGFLTPDGTWPVYISPRRIAMAPLVIEEDVGAKTFEERPLVLPGEKKGFIDTHAPTPQSTNDAFVCRGASSCHKRGADQRFVSLKLRLDVVKCGEEGLEWATGQGMSFRSVSMR